MTKRNIVHIEIPAAGLQKTGQFYKDLFGWEVQQIPEMNYATWETAEAPGGGFAPLTDDTQVGNVLIHINSDDIEADLKKAVKLGATIVREKQEIPDIGWWGVFKDPTGNNIALYTSMDPKFNK